MDGPNVFTFGNSVLAFEDAFLFGDFEDSFLVWYFGETFHFLELWGYFSYWYFEDAFLFGDFEDTFLFFGTLRILFSLGTLRIFFFFLELWEYFSFFELWGYFSCLAKWNFESAPFIFFPIVQIVQNSFLHLKSLSLSKPTSYSSCIALSRVYSTRCGQENTKTSFVIVILFDKR